ncbi:MAG: regulatory protein RecX [Acidobacteriota bacterium]
MAFGRHRASNKVTGTRGRKLEERPARGRLGTDEYEPGRHSAEPPADKVMGAALKILATRACSEGELRDKLIARRGSDTDQVEKCIERLKELGYVNDDLFAHSYASYRVRLKPLGRARLARELAVKKVSRNRIDDALDLVFGEVAEETLIDRAIGRRIRTHGRPADRAAAKRMFDHLARLGFEYDLISRKLRALKTEPDGDDPSD